MHNVIPKGALVEFGSFLRNGRRMGEGIGYVKFIDGNGDYHVEIDGGMAIVCNPDKHHHYDYIREIEEEN